MIWTRSVSTTPSKKKLAKTENLNKVKNTQDLSSFLILASLGPDDETFQSFFDWVLNLRNMGIVR